MYFTVTQASEWFAARGVSIHRTSIWRWITEGKVEAARIGDRYHIHEDALRKMLPGEAEKGECE